MENYNIKKFLYYAQHIRYIAEILKNRLEEVMERKNILPEIQTGFRKIKSTIDNIFMLNHIVHRDKVRNNKKAKSMHYS